MSIIPVSRPRWDLRRVTRLLDLHGTFDATVRILACRGFYRDSMGVPGRNDRALYDDAIFLVAPHLFAAYNANTDPSPWGINPKIGKGYAMLTPGTWLYQVGWHKRGKPGGHEALVQAAEVVVDRRLKEFDEPILDQGWFGLNGHRGAELRTGSEGCQTIPPGQWGSFIANVKDALARADQRIVPYTLIEAQG